MCKNENTAFVYINQARYDGDMSEKTNGHEHGHHHHHHDHLSKPPRREDAWKYFAVAAVNGLLMAASSRFSSGSYAGNAFRAEYSHDLGDAGIQASRGIIAKFGFEEGKYYQRFRRVTYGATAALATWVAFRSTVDLVDLCMSNTLTLSTFNDTIGAGVVAAGNGVGYLIANTIDNSGDNARDMRRHTKVDFISSAGNAACIASGMFLPYIPQLSGLVFGGYTAWSFRPTKHNIEHHV